MKEEMEFVVFLVQNSRQDLACENKITYLLRTVCHMYTGAKFLRYPVLKWLLFLH